MWHFVIRFFLDKRNDKVEIFYDFDVKIENFQTSVLVK